jgi:hypothetical protein
VIQIRSLGALQSLALDGMWLGTVLGLLVQLLSVCVFRCQSHCFGTVVASDQCTSCTASIITTGSGCDCQDADLDSVKQHGDNATNHYDNHQYAAAAAAVQSTT